MQTPQGLDAQHRGELFPVNESRRTSPASRNSGKTGSGRLGSKTVLRVVRNFGVGTWVHDKRAKRKESKAPGIMRPTPPSFRPMTPEDFQKFFPLVDNWIWAVLAAHAGTARPVASRGFPRLPLYFTAETLASAKVVIMDRLPVPPLSSWGLTQFASFERRDPAGITYLDTCF